MCRDIFQITEYQAGGMPAVLAAAREYHDQEGLLNFLVGQPWYDPPLALKECYAEAVRNRVSHRYGPPGGIAECRTALAEQERKRGLQVDPAVITVGNGSKEILLALFNVLKPRSALIAVPAYPGHVVQLLASGTSLRAANTLGTGGRLTVEHLAALPEVPEVVVISAPANPHGAEYQPGQAAELVEWCSNHSVMLVVDEVYIELAASGGETFLQHDPEGGTVIAVRSISKSLGACGWRLGYAISNNRLAQSLALWQQQMLNPPALPVQMALARYLGDNTPDYQRIRRDYCKTIAIMGGILEQSSFELLPAGSGFYCFAAIPEAVLKKTGSSLTTARDLAGKAGILAWPGEDFLCGRHLRFSWAALEPGSAADVAGETQRRLHGYFAAIGS